MTAPVVFMIISAALWALAGLGAHIPRTSINFSSLGACAAAVAVACWWQIGTWC